MSTPIQVSAFSAYRHGFQDGAGMRPINRDRVGSVDDYERGYVDGRKAFRAAMDAERERLGMAPAMMLRPAGGEPCWRR